MSEEYVQTSVVIGKQTYRAIRVMGCCDRVAIYFRQDEDSEIVAFYQNSAESIARERLIDFEDSNLAPEFGTVLFDKNPLPREENHRKGDP